MKLFSAFSGLFGNHRKRMRVLTNSEVNFESITNENAEQEIQLHNNQIIDGYHEVFDH